MDLVTILVMGPLVLIGGLTIIFLLLWIQFYLFVINHARMLRKAGWIVITSYRINSAELNAVDPSNHDSFEYVKLYFSIKNKDEYQEN